MLTKIQEIAAKTSGKNILVSAGAGTGKTRVLVERFLHFVTDKQVPVTEILALTFTEKAANEMKSRIQKRLAEREFESARRELESSYISTIHAFAARVLREHPLEAGVNPDFMVLESEESDFLQEQALDQVLEERCAKGNETFELLRIYGESAVRGGLRKVFDAARQEGKTLAEFFKANAAREAAVLTDIVPVFKALGENALAAEWEKFRKREGWNWEGVEEFRDWAKGFSKKRGKKGETGWEEIKETCAAFLAGKIQEFMEPWSRRLEALALFFEETYENRKKEKGALDFDDLQIKCVRLFKKEDKACRRLREIYRKKFQQIMVDEFQDTNYLQLELIELLGGSQNLFFVGDYKQSIYRFRGAEPGLFREKETLYRDSDTGAKIDLIENFRSAGEVLDFVNRFFETLWQEDGQAFYRLETGRKPGKKAGPPGCGEAGTELLWVRQEEDEDLDQARMREADLIAQRILELRAGDESLEFGNIAILFQAMTDSPIYERALKKHGIPYYALSSRGFYNQPEIRDMISFLSFLENPLADIPLAAALRSPLFQVSDNSLFWLARHAHEAGAQDRPLYEGLKKIQAIQEITAKEKIKILSFLQTAEELLILKDRLRLTELLDLILEKTSCELTVLADSHGVRRYANLKKMISLAREFESSEPMALGVFLKTLERLESQEVRESEAQVEAEASGRVVRLLSIHRSKGLEFPVVFVADLGRGRQSSESKTVLAEAGMGYAMKVRNEKTLKWEEPSGWKEIHSRANQKDREEWKRLFYVAVTRAEDRLILSGVHKEKKKPKESFNEMSCWMDWMMALPEELLLGLEVREGIAKTSPGIEKQAGKEEMREFFERIESGADAEFKKVSREMKAAVEAEAARVVARAFEKKRSAARVVDLPVSAYVLYEKSPAAYRSVYEIGYDDPLRMEETSRETQPLEEEFDAADFGTRVHRVLELMDFRDPEKNFTQILQDAFAGREETERESARTVVAEFVKSDTFKALARAKRIYKELPFVLDERHGKLEGVIDVLFQDASGGWHILDYKTAVGDAGKVRDACYEFQIRVYALAVRELLGELPKSGILYFLKNSWDHAVTVSDALIQKTQGRVREIQEEILGAPDTESEVTS